MLQQQQPPGQPPVPGAGVPQRPPQDTVSHRGSNKHRTGRADEHGLFRLQVTRLLGRIPLMLSERVAERAVSATSLGHCLLQELPVAIDFRFGKALRRFAPQFRLQARLKKLTHELRRSVPVQDVVCGRADLHRAVSNLHLKNRSALIIDACLRFGLQLLPHLVDILLRLFRIRAGQKMFQLQLVGAAIFAIQRPLRTVCPRRRPWRCAPVRSDPRPCRHTPRPRIRQRSG